MAHFALLNKDNKVLQVIRVDNKYLLEDKIEKESKGIDWLFNEFKINQQSAFLNVVDAKQTIFDGSIRNKHAAIGDEYIDSLDIFRMPQPYPSWILNEDKTDWVAPVEKPKDSCYWNEATLKWIKT